MERRLDGAAGWAARLCVLPLIAAPVSNPDLPWHLRAAADAVAAGALPRADTYSFTRLGLPWVDFEWLFQLAALGFEAAGGAWGLWALKAVLWAAAAALAEAVARASGAGARARLVLAVWCAASLGRAELKPELFSVVFFLALLWALEASESSEAAGWGPRRGAAAAAALFALWGNLHGAWPVGLAAIAAYGAFGRPSLRGERFAAAGAGLAATLANPYGWGTWSVLVDHLRWGGVIQGRILEWGPLNPSNPFHVPQLVLLGAAAAGLASRRAPAPRAALAAALGLAGLLHARLMAFAVLPAALLAVEALAAEAERRALGAWARRGAWAAGAACAAFLVFQGAAMARPPRPADDSLMPLAAGEFIARELPRFAHRRVYNEWGWGGWLGRRFPDDIKVFQDGRYLFHPLLAEAAAAEASAEAWQAFLDRWQVDWALVADRPEADSGFPRGEWGLVHTDGRARVYVRRTAFPVDWVKGCARGAR